MMKWRSHYQILNISNVQVINIYLNYYMKDFIILVLLVALFGWGIVVWPLLIIASLLLALFIFVRVRNNEDAIKESVIAFDRNARTIFGKLWNLIKVILKIIGVLVAVFLAKYVVIGIGTFILYIIGLFS